MHNTLNGLNCIFYSVRYSFTNHKKMSIVSRTNNKLKIYTRYYTINMFPKCYSACGSKKKKLVATYYSRC
jgi:hypothetical protein